MSALRTAPRNGPAIKVEVNGAVVDAYEGETVAALLLVSKHDVFRHSRRGDPRGPFCLMGTCQECLVEIDGIPNRRACLQPVAAGMKIRCA